MILPKDRDPRLVTIRRGGTLTGADHHAFAQWAATCAEHVLPLFEAERPADDRPRKALEQARARARGEIRMSQAREAAFAANAAARDLEGAARHAAHAAGQAAAVAAGRAECRWQRMQLPAAIRELVLDDQRLRNAICWNVFDC